MNSRFKKTRRKEEDGTDEQGAVSVHEALLLLTLDFARLQNKSPQVSKLTMR